MYLRNRLKPGDSILPVPMGIPVTLQYSAKGVLEKVIVGYDYNQPDNPSMVQAIHQHNLAPIKVAIHSGTSWVKGVLYTNKEFFNVGTLPDCCIDSMIEAFLQKPANFKFYAGNVESTASVFKGTAPIINWLHMSGFTTLPNYIVPANTSEHNMKTLIFGTKYPFATPLIIGYMVYRNYEFSYISTELKQFQATKVTNYLDRFGCNRARIACELATEISVDYSVIARYNILLNTCFVQDQYNRTIYSHTNDKKPRTNRPWSITCSGCGRTITVPKTGDVISTKCSDPFCVTRMYPRINHFLDTLNSPVCLGYNDFTAARKAKQLLVLADVFDLPQFKDVVVKATIAEVIKSLISDSDEELFDTSIVDQFVSRCNNKIDTVMYYATHTDIINSELFIDAPNASQRTSKLINWFRIDDNISEMKAAFNSPHIHVEALEKKYDGNPIFATRHIALTGEFLHGTKAEVEAILRSYSAEIDAAVNANTNFLIVGDMLSNIDGKAVRYAKSNSIQVFQETEFFAAYKIDDDINAALNGEEK